MDIPTRFAERVYALVRQVPYGRVTTYGNVATLISSPRAARAVGNALKAGRWGPDPVPWHRVINGAGRISFKGDVARAGLQRALLEQEGVVFGPDERVDLERFGWWGEDFLD
jgi:methylated-DNA-protein-cysteine methyltransferase-like protein